MKNELVKSDQLPITEIMSIGKAFAESGMFPDIKSAAQAVVKIQAGQEMGIAPFAAMSGIHIIVGKPVPGSGIIASKVKSSQKYDYKVIEHTNSKCSLDFYEGKQLLGNSTFTIEDARKAGTKNTDKFPKNMLFARAISNGQKWFCPDVFLCAVYAEGELDEFKTEDVDHEAIHPAKIDEIKSDTTPDEPFVIPGHWHAKMEKCKSKADVLSVYQQHKETVDAHPELQELLKQTQNSFKKLQTV
jgi:hypothetical protein